jgi:hypothetical protein
MQPYANHHGNSGVVSFESGNDFIKIRFKHSPVVYVYTFALPGRMHVEEMKRLASGGYGLVPYSRNPFLKIKKSGEYFKIRILK